MRSHLSWSLLAFCALFTLVSVARADLKYETVSRNGGQESRQTTYMSANRFRMDMGPDTYTVFDCEKQQTLMINRKDKSCMRMPAGQMDAMMSGAPMGRPGPPPKPRKGGIVIERHEVADTGERKQIFGLTARHIIVTLRHDAGPDTCNPGKRTMKRDLWLVDLSFPFRCERFTPPPARTPPQARMPGERAERPECEDEIRASMKGDPPLEQGFVIREISTEIDEQGEREVNNMEIVSLSSAPLDASVFESPYECVEFSVEAMMGRAGRTPSRAPRTEPVPDTQERSRREGVLLVGVVPFKDATGKSLDLEALRQALVSELDQPAWVEAISLLATEPTEVLNEAREKHCAYVVHTNLLESKVSAASKIGGLLGRATGVGSGQSKISVKLEYQLVKVETASQVSKRPVTDSSTADSAEATGAERMVLTRATTEALSKEASAVLADIRSDRKR